MSDKWKHENWHNTKSGREICGKCEIAACPYCEIERLQAQLAQLEEDYRLLKALYKQEAHS